MSLHDDRSMTVLSVFIGTQHSMSLTFWGPGMVEGAALAECPRCRELEEKVGKLEAELEVEREFSRQLMDTKRCPDCERQRRDWYH
jgi:hypothetical protein